MCQLRRVAFAPILDDTGLQHSECVNNARRSTTIFYFPDSVCLASQNHIHCAQMLFDADISSHFVRDTGLKDKSTHGPWPLLLCFRRGFKKKQKETWHWGGKRWSDDTPLCFSITHMPWKHYPASCDITSKSGRFNLWFPVITFSFPRHLRHLPVPTPRTPPTPAHQPCPSPPIIRRKKNAIPSIRVIFSRSTLSATLSNSTTGAWEETWPSINTLGR